MGVIKKKNVMNLLSAELIHRVVKVNRSSGTTGSVANSVDPDLANCCIRSSLNWV